MLALRDCSIGATSQGNWELPEAERDKEHIFPLSFQEKQGLLVKERTKGDASGPRRVHRTGVQSQQGI